MHPPRKDDEVVIVLEHDACDLCVVVVSHPGFAFRYGYSARCAVGMGGKARVARVSPYAAFRFEKTRVMVVLGSVGVF